MRAEAINAGVSGFGTAEALAFLENEGHYRPDVVVLGFYANDFEDNLKAGLFALDPTASWPSEARAHAGREDPERPLQPRAGALAVARTPTSIRCSSTRSGTLQGARRAGACQAADRVRRGEPQASRREVELATALILRMHAVCASTASA